MNNSQHIVYGLFATRAALETAVGRLKGEGFSSSDISTLLPCFDGSEEFTNAAGPAGGAVLGGALGWLAGIGTLAIPGLGPFVAAGPILATIGTTDETETHNGVASALKAIGLADFEAKRCEVAIHDGEMLLSVHGGPGEWEDKVMLILMECGAHDINSTEDTDAFLRSQTAGGASEKHPRR